MSLPTYERRFYLGLLTKDASERQEAAEIAKEQAKTSGSKGNRTTRIGGNQLKNRMKNGDIPTK